MEKAAYETTKKEWQEALKRDEQDLKKLRKDMADLKAGKAVENLTLENAKTIEQGLEATIQSKKRMISKLAAVEFQTVLEARVASDEIKDEPAHQRSEAYRTEKNHKYYPQKMPDGMKLPSKWLRGLPNEAKRAIDDMPAADLDKNESYDHPKIKALQKKLEDGLKSGKLDQEDIKKGYINVQKAQHKAARAYMDAKTDEAADPHRFAMRKLLYVWRAYNVVWQDLTDPQQPDAPSVLGDMKVRRKAERSKKNADKFFKQFERALKAWSRTSDYKYRGDRDEGKKKAIANIEKAKDRLLDEAKAGMKLADGVIDKGKSSKSRGDQNQIKALQESYDRAEKAFKELRDDKVDQESPLAGYSYERRMEALYEAYTHLAFMTGVITHMDKTASVDPVFEFEAALHVAATEKQADLRLGPKDKKVIDAFYEHKSMESKKLSTDGERLDGNWMGGDKIAYWKGGKVHISDVGSRAGQTVAKAVKKAVPSNYLAKEASMSNPRVAFEEALEAQEPDFYLTAEEVADICLPCAEKMVELEMEKVAASELFGQDKDKVAAKWETMPEGWTDESRKKFWKSIGGDVKKCMKKMEGKVSDTGAFCASLKDRIEGTTKWRGPEKPKKKKTARMDFEEALRKAAR